MADKNLVVLTEAGIAFRMKAHHWGGDVASKTVEVYKSPANGGEPGHTNPCVQLAEFKDVHAVYWEDEVDLISLATEEPPEEPD